MAPQYPKFYTFSNLQKESILRLFLQMHWHGTTQHTHLKLLLFEFQLGQKMPKII